MPIDPATLRLAGIDERNLRTIREYEEYLTNVLPASETIRDLFIEVNIQLALSDLYLFTGQFMVEVPDFVTYYEGKMHAKKINFSIHPLKNAVTFFNQKITGPADSGPRTVEVNFRLKSGSTFSFMEIKENSERLEYIARTYLIPNLEKG